MDLFLVEQHERFAHWFQRLSGLTNFWLAKIAWFMFTASLGVTMCLPFKNTSGPDARIMGLVGMVALLALGARVVRFCDYLDNYYANGARAMHVSTQIQREAWPVRFVLYFSIMVLALAPLSILRWVDGWFVLFLILWSSIIPWSYFMASVPLPPQFDMELAPVPVR